MFAKQILQYAVTCELWLTDAFYLLKICATSAFLWNGVEDLHKLDGWFHVAFYCFFQV